MLLEALPILAKYHRVSKDPKTLAIVLVGTNPASDIYVKIKTTKAESYNVATRLVRLAHSSSVDQICQTIRTQNQDDSVDAIIVQLPLPDARHTVPVLDAISPTKDVDNLTGKNQFTSPMVQAIEALLVEYRLTLEGKIVCVIGHGRLVGQPVVQWLRSKGIHPTIIESADNFDNSQVLASDVIIAGTGSRYCVNASNTRSGQVVFDCSGVDVDFDAVKNRVLAITPPKGGVGPLTVHFLLTNVMRA